MTTKETHSGAAMRTATSRPGWLRPSRRSPAIPMETSGNTRDYSSLISASPAATGCSSACRASRFSGATAIKESASNARSPDSGSGSVRSRYNRKLTGRQKLGHSITAPTSLHSRRAQSISYLKSFGLTARTEQGDSRTMRSATVPSSTALMPVRPRVPTTTRSAPEPSIN